MVPLPSSEGIGAGAIFACKDRIVFDADDMTDGDYSCKAIHIELPDYIVTNLFTEGKLTKDAKHDG